MNDHDFPGVLFVTPLAFNAFTGGGVTFSNLFRGWPQDRLFTVHDDPLPLSHDVCTNYFRLGADELALRWPLRALRQLLRRDARHGSSEDGGWTATTAAAATPPAGPLRRLAHAAVGAVFGNAGMPMVARLTPRLEAWVTAARPEVIYTILGSSEMMDLVALLARRFDLPVVVHIMDDWRAERGRGGILSPFARHRLRRAFDASIRNARARLAICDAMATAYARAYGVPFEAVQNVLDTPDWLAAARRDIVPGKPARVLYAGSLYPNVQLESLRDIAAAIGRLRADGVDIVLDVMCPEFMVAPWRRSLEAHDGTRVVAQVSRSGYFATVCAADLLLLPVNFAASTIRFVRYSMPTKVPEYLVSGVPVLLYGPAGIAQIDYARDAGWGLAVTTRDASALDGALRRATGDLDLRRSLVARARDVAARRHDADGVRTRFRATLARAAGSRRRRPPEEIRE